MLKDDEEKGIWIFPKRPDLVDKRFSSNLILTKEEKPKKGISINKQSVSLPSRFRTVVAQEEIRR